MEQLFSRPKKHAIQGHTQKVVERECDKNACLQISRASRDEEFFFRSTFSDLYQGTYSTVIVTFTSILAKNDILRFSEEDLKGCVRIEAPLCTPLMQLLNKVSSMVHFVYNKLCLTIA